MTFTWQDAIALLAVAAAALYVVRHVRRMGTEKRRTGCGGCAGCSAQSPPAPLISIDPRPKS